MKTVMGFMVLHRFYRLLLLKSKRPRSQRGWGWLLCLPNHTLPQACGKRQTAPRFSINRKISELSRTLGALSEYEYQLRLHHWILRYIWHGHRRAPNLQTLSRVLAMSLETYHSAHLTTQAVQRSAHVQSYSERDFLSFASLDCRHRVQHVGRE